MCNITPMPLQCKNLPICSQAAPQMHVGKAFRISASSFTLWEYYGTIMYVHVCIDYQVHFPAVAPPSPGSNCAGNQFECLSTSECVPLASQCDGTEDCQNAEDEMTCGTFSLRSQPHTCTVHAYVCT